MGPVETYLSEMRELRSARAGVKETTYYTALANLLDQVGKTLKPRVRCILQLQNRGAGNPDGGLFTADQFPKGSAEPAGAGIPSRGVIEIKSTSEDAWITADGELVSKYWGRYNQVLVTNYRDFVLVGRDTEGRQIKLETYRLARSEAEFWADAHHPAKTAAYDVYLNGKAFWTNIPSAVWEYTLGGYQVTKKWLSYRENSLLGRGLTKDEARHVTDMARRIAALLLMGPALDANYEAVKRDTYVNNQVFTRHQ